MDTKQHVELTSAMSVLAENLEVGDHHRIYDNLTVTRVDRNLGTVKVTWSNKDTQMLYRKEHAHVRLTVGDPRSVAGDN